MPYGTESAAWNHYTVLPADCLRFLPFKPEPLVSWRQGGDLSQFLRRYRADDPYADYFASTAGCGGRDSAKTFYALADELSKGSENTYHQKQEARPPKIDFRRNTAFGGFAKAWLVWDLVDHELLSEAGFYSLSHTLEAKTDIDCALELLAKFYYRQAIICLRTFVEDIVTPLYFLHRAEAFEAWQGGRIRLPRMRGDGGILSELVKRKALTEEVAERLGRAYERQNHAVHGDAASIVHAGAFSSDWRGLSFKADELQSWLTMAQDCIECGLVVVKQTSDAWLAAQSGKDHICSCCHSCDFTAVEEPKSGANASKITLGGVTIELPPPEQPGQPLYRFECRKCGHTWHGTLKS